ncbi:MAG: hypothetical protein LBG05_00730 [Treponema sp.]|nr:hypothetical protein [Treponema sp.]
MSDTVQLRVPLRVSAPSSIEPQRCSVLRLACGQGCAAPRYAAQKSVR